MGQRIAAKFPTWILQCATQNSPQAALSDNGYHALGLPFAPPHFDHGALLQPLSEG